MSSFDCTNPSVCRNHFKTLKIWIVSGVLVNILGQGMVLSYPSCLLPGLRAKDSDIHIDLETASWLASSIGFSSILGFFLSSFFMQWRGRRFAHAIMIIPGLLGWILIYFSKNVGMLIAGRILGGITAGATVTLGAVVIGEYTSPQNRGIFLNLKTAATCVGNTVMHILGHYLHWRTVAICALVPTTAALFNIFTWPESPSYLISKKQFTESEKVFLWLRGDRSEVVKEYDELLEGQKHKMKDQKENESCKEVVVSFFKKFTEKDFIKPVFIIFFSFLLLEACGRHTFPAYALDIIGGISGDKTQSFVYTLSIDIITALSATFSCVLVKMMKRRTLLFFSGISALTFLCCISLYLYLSANGIISNDKPWIPLSLLIGYFVVANFGCTPIPLALLGEVFPLRHRAAGSSISGLAMSISLLIALKVTPVMLLTIKVHGTFAVYAITMFLTLVYLYFTLPETKDRTLQQIEDFFNHGKLSNEWKDDQESKEKMLKEKA